jgi:hypothetical protein
MDVNNVVEPIVPSTGFPENAGGFMICRSTYDEMLKPLRTAMENR